MTSRFKFHYERVSDKMDILQHFNMSLETCNLFLTFIWMNIEKLVHYKTKFDIEAPLQTPPTITAKIQRSCGDFYTFFTVPLHSIFSELLRQFLLLRISLAQ